MLRDSYIGQLCKPRWQTDETKIPQVLGGPLQASAIQTHPLHLLTQKNKLQLETELCSVYTGPPMYSNVVCDIWHCLAFCKTTLEHSVIPTAAFSRHHYTCSMFSPSSRCLLRLVYSSVGQVSEFSWEPPRFSGGFLFWQGIGSVFACCKNRQLREPAVWEMLGLIPAITLNPQICWKVHSSSGFQC
jgi:hypothetical protein